jgi:urease accessory protein
LPLTDLLSFLQLLQLADSALPIGSLSHSFGLESIIADSDIDPSDSNRPRSLAWYLEDALEEATLVDAVFCREAYQCAIGGGSVAVLNRELSALRMARESREASLTLGRRFAALAASIHPVPALSSLSTIDELHHAVAFGYAMGVLRIPEEFAVSAFLQQSILNLISAAQRLMPLGQREANRITWELKPAMLRCVERARSISFTEVCSFAHLPETESMRHSSLPTRLFVS